MNDTLSLAVNGLTLRRPILISGPCSAETEEQVENAAAQLAAQGIKIFRAGIWKPRTKPGGFEGVGPVGLPWLIDSARRHGMLAATEVATPGHVQAAARAGVDILWIGARTSANPFAMQDLAEALAAYCPDTPVLVKNPVNPDLELWVGALQRLYNAGIKRLGAIHRGFSCFGESAYRNNPCWSIPLQLRVRYPQLPVIFDPSHIGGDRDLIAPLSQQALDMGFDGLIIESHCNPDKAWSDAKQQITPERLGQIISALNFRSAPAKEDTLAELRVKIDSLDRELLDILARRMDISRQIGAYKKENGIAVVQPGRYSDVMATRIDSARKLGLGPDFMQAILSAIHEESVRLQIQGD